MPTEITPQVSQLVTSAAVIIGLVMGVSLFAALLPRLFDGLFED